MHGVFPTTKIVMRRVPQPLNDSQYIRIKFLERPWRYWSALSYHWQAFAKTVVLSILLIFPVYHLVYLIARCTARAEIMGKMDPQFSSDAVRQSVIDYKRRVRKGEVQSYLDAEMKDSKGISPALK